jgi:ABC-type hemin transport system ATPase subunit
VCVLHVLSFRAAECDNWLLFDGGKVRERLAVTKQTTRRFNMERLSLKKLNEVEGKEQNRVLISNRFVALENSDAEEDINRVWETVRGNIKTSA